MIQLGFLRKEFKESIKTPKLLIVSVMFIFFALLSPITARYINEIISTIGDGIKIEFPTPTFIDSWVQFFKNTTSICYIVLLLMTTGTVVSEKTKGSIMLVLSKNITRTNFILSKITSGILLLTTGYILSVLVCTYYTGLLFPEYINSNVWFSIFLIYILGVFYVSFGILASVLSKSSTTAAIIGFAGYAVINALTISPILAKYSPAGLSTIVNKIISGQSGTSDSLVPLLSTLILIIITNALSVLIFRKQEL